jgi:hypothetical protein
LNISPFFTHQIIAAVFDYIIQSPFIFQINEV